MGERLPVTLEGLRRAVAEGRWALTNHARIQAGRRYIEAETLVRALAAGEILESYPADPRGPSALLLAYGPSGRPLHSVCTFDPAGTLLLITVYEPEPPRWVDHRTRGIKS